MIPDPKDLVLAVEHYDVNPPNYDINAIDYNNRTAAENNAYNLINNRNLTTGNPAARYNLAQPNAGTSAFQKLSVDFERSNEHVNGQRLVFVTPTDAKSASLPKDERHKQAPHVGLTANVNYFQDTNSGGGVNVSDRNKINTIGIPVINSKNKAPSKRQLEHSIEEIFYNMGQGNLVMIPTYICNAQQQHRVKQSYVSNNNIPNQTILDLNTNHLDNRQFFRGLDSQNQKQGADFDNKFAEFYDNELTFVLFAQARIQEIKNEFNQTETQKNQDKQASEARVSDIDKILNNGIGQATLNAVINGNAGAGTNANQAEITRALTAAAQGLNPQVIIANLNASLLQLRNTAGNNTKTLKELLALQKTQEEQKQQRLEQEKAAALAEFKKQYQKMMDVMDAQNPGYRRAFEMGLKAKREHRYDDTYPLYTTKANQELMSSYATSVVLHHEAMTDTHKKSFDELEGGFKKVEGEELKKLGARTGAKAIKTPRGDMIIQENKTAEVRIGHPINPQKVAKDIVEYFLKVHHANGNNVISLMEFSPGGNLQGQAAEQMRNRFIKAVIDEVRQRKHDKPTELAGLKIELNPGFGYETNYEDEQNELFHNSVSAAASKKIGGP